MMKAGCALALAGILLIVSSRSPMGRQTAEMPATDFEAVCGRARQYLREGRCDRALAAVAAIEDEVRDNVEREPGRELSLLMIKARAYWLQMDIEGLERFLTQFEKDYADTSAAPWVQRAAWYERMLGYRFSENLPEAVRAFEKYRELEEQHAASRDVRDELDAVARDFDLHVKMPTEIGDLYRYLGKRESALAQYRSALEQVTRRRTRYELLDRHRDRLLDESVCPSKYRNEILPTVIRQCEAAEDGALSLLDCSVVCEVQQADWLLSVARGCRQQRAIEAAREHYRNACRALETHQGELDFLSPGDKARFVTLREQILRNLDICDAALPQLHESRF